MKTLKLLLTETVDNLGIVGDVVSVKPGYARNFLLPRGYATEPTEHNVRRLAERREQVEKQLRQERQQQEKTIQKLEGFEFTIQRSANDQGILYGGVSQHDIADVLRGEGLPIDDRNIGVGQQIKRLDSYMIPIVFDRDLKTEIKLWVVSDKPHDKLATNESPDAGNSEKELSLSEDRKEDAERS